MDKSDYDMEDIRKPDNIINDQLLEDNRTIEEINTENALFLSMKELYETQKKSDEFEKQLIVEYINEKNKRKEEMEPILCKIAQVSNYDKNVKEIYKLIEPIIELYINQYINSYVVDDETYTRIFKVLSSIRIDQNILKNIITK